MALSIRNFCLHRNFNYLLFNNKFIIILPLQNSLRYLRGSRLGRELDKTEARFQELLKTLKESSKKSVINTTEVPKTVVKSVAQTEEIKEVPAKVQHIPDEDICKRLEGKITPLKKLTYARQLERKYNKSLSLLRMFGEKLRSLKMPITLGSDKLPCPVELMLPSPFIEGYRNQDEFSIGIGLDGNPKTVGFYLDNIADGSNMVCVGPDELVIIRENHKKFVKDFQYYIRNSSLPAMVKIDDEGYWKSISMRSNSAGELMGVIGMHPQDLTQDQLQQEKNNLKQFFEANESAYNLKSLYFQACSSSRCSSNQAPYELLFGDSVIVEDFNKLKIQISPGSFFPTNTYAAETMYEALLKLCRVNDSTTVLDIFCGTGLASLIYSPLVKKCIGFDACSQVINDAKNNAMINKKHNVEFIHGNPDVVLKDIFTNDYYSDLIAVINPSRTELSKTAVKFLRECKYLKKIIYISTKPRSAVDNFIKLCKPAGAEAYLGKYFVPLLALPVDLCPQTEHYGLVIMFQRL